MRIGLSGCLLCMCIDCPSVPPFNNSVGPAKISKILEAEMLRKQQQAPVGSTLQQIGALLD